MPKVFYIIMMSLWIVSWIILFIENMIGSAWTAYTLIWQSSVQALVLFALFCWFFIWYWLKGFFSSDNDDENHENF